MKKAMKIPAITLTEPETFRWGIASAGRVSFDFVNAIRLLPKSQHEVVAIASRDITRSKEFASKFDIAVAYGSYEDLAKATDIDCVYIGSIHTQHFALSKMMIEAGKNVLCEKPMCMNSRQCEQILKLAKQKNVFFVEGFWSRFFPAYDSLMADLIGGSIGDVKIIQVNFGDNISSTTEMKRLRDKALGGGALLDIGCYPIQFAQFIFKEYPQKITSAACLNENGVDETVVTTLTYSNDRMAVLTCSFSCALDNTANIYGTKGHIKLENFWNPEEVTTPKGTYKYPLGELNPPYPMNYRRSEGFVYEIENVKTSINSGLKESPHMKHAESLEICKITDEIRKQCGIMYAEDEH